MIRPSDAQCSSYRHINTTLSLRAEESVNGTFDVTAHTSGAPLDLRFVEAPVDSQLRVNARTTRAPAHVILHDTYQGAFMLNTSLCEPSLYWSEGAEDPAGRGRRRTVQWEEWKGKEGERSKYGYAMWVGGGNTPEVTKGDVRMSTSLTSLRLDIGQVE